MYDQVNFIDGCNGEHSDASYHHCHDVVLEGPIQRDEGIGKVNPEIFLIPPTDLMTVGSVVMADMKETHTTVLKVVPDESYMPTKEAQAKLKSEGKNWSVEVPLKGNVVHMQFFTQLLFKHSVPHLCHPSLVRAVATIRLSLLPSHGDIFSKMLKRWNVPTERHDQYKLLQTYNKYKKVSESGTNAFASTALLNSSEQDRVTTKMSKKESETLLEGPLWTPVYDDDLVCYFTSGQKIGTRYESLLATAGQTLQLLMLQEAAFVELYDFPSSSECPSKQMRTNPKFYQHGVSPEMFCYDDPCKINGEPVLKNFGRLLPGDVVRARDVDHKYNIRSNDYQTDAWNRDGGIINGIKIRCPEKNNFVANYQMMKKLNFSRISKEALDLRELVQYIVNGLQPTYVLGSGGNEMVSGAQAQNVSTINVAGAKKAGTLAKPQNLNAVLNQTFVQCVRNNGVISLFHPVQCDKFHPSLHGEDLVVFLGVFIMKRIILENFDSRTIVDKFESTSDVSKTKLSESSCLADGPIIGELEPYLFGITTENNAENQIQAILNVYGKGTVLRKLCIPRKLQNVVEITIPLQASQTYVIDRFDHAKWFLNNYRNKLMSPVAGPTCNSVNDDSVNDDVAEDREQAEDNYDDDFQDEGDPRNKMLFKNSATLAINLAASVGVACSARARMDNVYFPLGKQDCVPELHYLKGPFASLPGVVRCTPTPCPNRAFDKTTALLMNMTEGSLKDMSEVEITSSLPFVMLSWKDTDIEFRRKFLLSSIVLRYFGNVYGLTAFWAHSHDKRQSQDKTIPPWKLFDLSSVHEFTQYIKKTCDTGPGHRHKVGKLFVNPQLQGSVPDSLKTNVNAVQYFIDHLVEELFHLESLLNVATSENSQHTLLQVIVALKKRLDGGLQEAKDRQKTGFLALQIMEDQMLIYKNKPWGDETDAVYIFKGYGGDQGISAWEVPAKEPGPTASQEEQEWWQLAQLSEPEYLQDYSIYKKHKQSSYGQYRCALAQYLHHLKQVPDDILIMQFLKRVTINDESIVVNVFNEKPVGAILFEHVNCKEAILVLRCHGTTATNVPSPYSVKSYPCLVEGVIPKCMMEVFEQIVHVYFSRGNVPDVGEAFTLKLDN